MIDFPGSVPYESLSQLVDDAGRKFRDAPLWISIDDDTRISHAEFAALTVRCADAFRARGVRHGTHVAVMLPAVPAYPITWFALARIGAVMVPLNTQYKAADLEYVLRDSDSTFLVIDESALPAFESIMTRDAVIPPSNRIVHRLASDFVQDCRGPAAPARNDDADERVGPETLMSIQYTSGSTGFPKGCML